MTPQLERIANDVEGFLAEHQRKQLVRLVVVGSVDDGKSTLIGRLLHETGALYEDQIAQVRRASKGGELDFSLFTDGLRAEREQGITIDVAYRYFSTTHRKFVVADTPGHVQYTRNMATGASTADLAVILVDARLGVLAQSRRHAHIASLLGIRQLAVAVNKMDLVDFDPAVFMAIQSELDAFVADLGFSEVTYFPVSATRGDNVVERSARSPWYDGPTLLKYLENAPLAHEPAGLPLRFPVQLVLRPHLDYRGFAGRIESGSLAPGDEVIVLPSGKRTRVASIDTFEGSLPRASAPSSVTLRLADEVDVSRGDLLVSVGDLPRVRHRFDAVIVWLNEKALDPARTYLLKHATRTVSARLDRVHWRTDPELLTHVPSDVLTLNDIGRVTVTCHRALCLDGYARNRNMGRFIVIDAITNATVGGGIVLDSAEEGSLAPREDAPAGTSLVSRDERRLQLGHGAALVLVSGEGSSPAASLHRLERTLFETGRSAFVLESVTSALLLAVAGLIALTRAPTDDRQKEVLRAAAIAGGVAFLEWQALTESVEEFARHVHETTSNDRGSATTGT